MMNSNLQNKIEDFKDIFAECKYMEKKGVSDELRAKLNKLMEKAAQSQLAKYYEYRDLTIIGLNDSQGVNTAWPFGNSVLDYVAELLKENNSESTIIDAFSMLLNKTEHIDYLLDSNISLEDIKKSQLYSVVSAYKKVMRDTKMPEKIGTILGGSYKSKYTVQPGDEKIHITDVLKESNEPNVIYSSGVNNLMREVGNNPFAIKKDYENRNITPNYNYTLERAKDPNTLANVMNGMERNFNHIYLLNKTADIYTLGAYVPTSLKTEGMDIFRDLIIDYNEKLEKLCKDYNITFINTKVIGEEYNKSKMNFHVNSNGHKNIANAILLAMYRNKILEEKQSNDMMYFYDSNVHSKDAIDNMILSLFSDYCTTTTSSINLEGYEKLRMEAVAEEHEREQKVFQKIKQDRIQRQ